MREIVVATRNRHKLDEIRDILRDLSIELVSGVDLGVPDIVEDEPTLEDNARKKALLTAQATGRIALADDTGLEVDALSGAPGVHSARYAGPACDPRRNMEKLLAALAGVPRERRKARFRCVMALAAPGGRGAVQTFEGVLEGRIAESPRGAHGFGYDPIFLVDDGDRTLAELPPDEKNQVSHRARALARLRADIAAGLCTELADMPLTHEGRTR